MVEYMIALALYIFTIIAIVIVGKKARKHFSIISFPYFMRCMTVLITIPFNFLVSVYAFIALYCQMTMHGYLRIFYYSSLSWLVYMMMLLFERYVVKIYIIASWKLDLKEDLIKNISYYEQRIEKFSKDSENFSEAVYALNYLYKIIICRAKSRGEDALAADCEKRFSDLVERVGVN